MRLFIFITSILFSVTCFAAHVTCYSAGHTMFDGEVQKQFYMTQDNMLIFKDKATHREIYVMASDCVFKL